MAKLFSLCMIDFTAISFPTDRLTIAEMRRVYPHSFDLPSPVDPITQPHAFGRNSIECTLGGIIDAERTIASLAFKRIVGLPLTPQESRQSRDDHLHDLTDCYVELGLAAGEHHAEQLVRNIESQAIAQAERFLGHTP